MINCIAVDDSSRNISNGCWGGTWTIETKPNQKGLLFDSILFLENAFSFTCDNQHFQRRVYSHLGGGKKYPRCNRCDVHALKIRRHIKAADFCHISQDTIAVCVTSEVNIEGEPVLQKGDSRHVFAVVVHFELFHYLSCVEHNKSDSFLFGSNKVILIIHMPEFVLVPVKLRFEVIVIVQPRSCDNVCIWPNRTSRLVLSIQILIC
mmetsp:Transcript_4537/g.6886  ORF Transcript_4537/g.6886 Transcript_4537/m.6886 type:complete len:206 (+) Transcript_4537:412-1029(+)